MAALPYLLPGLLAAGAAWAIARLRKNAKTAPLAEGVEVAEEALDEAVKALPGGPGAALKAAEGVIVKDKASLVAAAEAELIALAGVEAPTTAVTDGGATVNLPK